ncbi:nicotinate-nucleotide--dimethylbenzimidazole phosphoribosyltransferase, partial [Vibrio parahaemolyticus]
MDDSFAAEIQARIDNKTKPVGSLGLLEKVALQLAL